MAEYSMKLCPYSCLRSRKTDLTVWYKKYNILLRYRVIDWRMFAMKNKKMIFFLCGSVIIIMLVCVIVFSKMIQYMNQQNDDALHEVGELYMKEMSNQISSHFTSVMDLRISRQLVPEHHLNRWRNLIRHLLMR